MSEEREGRLRVEKRDGVFFVLGDLVRGEPFEGLEVDSGQQIFDMSEVRIVSSAGTRDWLCFLEKNKVSPIYRECSEQIVHQFNMVRDFLKNGQVESVQLPYTCVRCGMSSVAIMRWGEHFDASGVIKLPAISCRGSDCEIIIDIEIDSYFCFVECLKSRE